MMMKCRYLEFPERPPREGGIDVGGGGDRTVLRERCDRRAGREVEFLDNDPMRSVGRLVESINEWGLDRVKVDSTGLGWGLAGRLKELSKKHNPTSKETTHNAEVIAVNFGASAPPGYERKFLNMRAYLWWQVGRELSRLQGWDLSEVDDDVIDELSKPRYVIMDSYGKIKIESKKEVIKRLGMSPDRAEALLLAFYEARKEAKTAGWSMYAQGSLMTSTSPTDRLATV
jgi:hypothetical protein